jgi:hypothetical protein
MYNHKQLIRLRWAVRIVLTLGVAASVAANILHAQPNPISRTIAAWPPLALLLTVELVSRIPVTRWWRALIRISATATIASIAGWISYWHMQGVTARYGESGSSSYLIPLTVDGLIVVASISLVELAYKLRSIEEGPQATQPKTVKEQVNEIADRLPIPVSPAAQPAEPKPPVVTSRTREHRPAGRTGPQVNGPSLPGLSGRPLMEAPPQV